jgi:hypothetical protein
MFHPTVSVMVQTRFNGSTVGDFSLLVALRLQLTTTRCMYNRINIKIVNYWTLQKEWLLSH